MFLFKLFVTSSLFSLLFGQTVPVQTLGKEAQQSELTIDDSTKNLINGQLSKICLDSDTLCNSPLNNDQIQSKGLAFDIQIVSDPDKDKIVIGIGTLLKNKQLLNGIIVQYYDSNGKVTEGRVDASEIEIYDASSSGTTSESSSNSYANTVVEFSNVASNTPKYTTLGQVPDSPTSDYSFKLRVYYADNWYWYWFNWTPWWRCKWYYQVWNWFCPCNCWRPIWYIWNNEWWYWYQGWYYPYWYRCWYWGWYPNYCYWFPRCWSWYWWW